jgi:2-polyprenyl-6-methoxyphenol hydroxylase-like FAD-dependent oxidoreductase
VNGTAVVVGGGIAGLAAAGGLTRTGWRVAVLERADAFTDVDPTKKRATKGVR